MVILNWFLLWPIGTRSELSLKNQDISQLSSSMEIEELNISRLFLICWKATERSVWVACQHHHFAIFPQWWYHGDSRIVKHLPRRSTWQHRFSFTHRCRLLLQHQPRAFTVACSYFVERINIGRGVWKAKDTGKPLKCEEAGLCERNEASRTYRETKKLSCLLKSPRVSPELSSFPTYL